MQRLAIVTAFLALCAAPALAQQPACQLQMVNTIPLTMSPNGLRALVPVTINGSPERMLLDTGGAMTQLSHATIERLKLPVRDGGIKMLDLYGRAAEGMAMVDSLVLGRLKDNKTELPVSPFDFGGTPPVAGLLAADYMGSYDLEFDFANAKLNYLSKQHCPGKVIYWPATAIAVVPFKFINNHMQIDVELNGKHVRAEIDTGAPNTTLLATEAKRLFDLTEKSPDITGLQGAEGEKSFEKIFDTLTLDGIGVGHPHITIIPDLVGKHDVNNDYVTGSRVQRVDDRETNEPTMLLGMNILTKLRFVIAFSENRIYLTAATPPQPVPAAPH
jgi:predicted aspartyl protease